MDNDGRAGDRHRLPTDGSTTTEQLMRPRVSVIVPARNEAKTIEECLRSIFAQKVEADGSDRRRRRLERRRRLSLGPQEPGWSGTLLRPRRRV